jgi:hypothetical protein
MKKKNKDTKEFPSTSDVDDSEELPNEDLPNETPSPEDWYELTSLPIRQMVTDGWIPRVRNLRNGKQVITLRLVERDDDGKRRDKERGLGPYSDERWAKLLSYFPQLKVGTSKESESTESKGSTILSTKVDKPKPLSSSIHFNLSTLQWYRWTQENTGYPGNLEDFVNDCIDAYFRKHHKLELAVIHGSD